MKRLVLIIGACGSVVGAMGACGSSETEGELVSPDAGQPDTGPIDLGGGGSPGDSGGDEAVCGDSRIGGEETCDDGNAVAGDGCDASCQLEPGWSCTLTGVACTAAECGDGLEIAQEECDDGNAAPGDGCDASCLLEPGYKCPTPGSSCEPTVCGDKAVEGTEQCDDGNNDFGDGCTPNCTIEPDCSSGACTSTCGDGIKFDNEACDDGNSRAGDGCSETCEIEEGYTCSVDQEDLETLSLPIVYRDFDAGKPYHDEPLADGHPDIEPHGDFEWPFGEWPSVAGVKTGTVRTQLGHASDGAELTGKPVFAFRDADDNSDGLADNCPLSPGDVVRAGNDYCASTIESAETFHQWYRDVPGVNKTVVRELVLTSENEGQYAFDSSDSGAGFFPIDDLGPTKTPQGSSTEESHNFHFTSEVRYWFEYDPAANATLSFRGDDDVFVFVNGRLVVDIGGVHGAKDGAVTLNAGAEDVGGTLLDLEAGKVYEIVVFQAERNCCGSNYKLTLDDFLLSGSTCESVCGDGVRTRDEQCDDGADNNTGGYGECASDCTLVGYCGDGILDEEHEECDDGNRHRNDGCDATCAIEVLR